MSETKALTADGTEDVGQETDVVLGNVLVLVDLVAALDIASVCTLVDDILNLVVGGWADLVARARVARQSHGSGSEEKGGNEELHCDDLGCEERLIGGIESG